MTGDALTQADLDALRAFDTPTICNALEVVAPERRAAGFTTEPLVCADPALPPIVGYARTATIRAAEPPPAPADELRSQRAAYYEYVGEGPGPTVMVIEDIDARPGFGAWWGEVNTTVHKALGSLGCVTNGSIRDLDMLAPGFQLLAGEVGPSHAWVHVVEYGRPVNVHGMGVRHGDLIHADRHGAVVVPLIVVRDLPAAVDLVARREKVILAACAQPNFDIAALKRAMAESAAIK